MTVYEINNLTLDPDKLTDYLVVPDYSTKHKFRYPLSMGRLDLLWVVKDKQYYSVNVIPFIDTTQEEYDALIEWIPGTLYRIFEDGAIVALYFNGIDYLHDASETKQLSLINEATLFMDEAGVIYNSILTNNAAIREFDLKEGVIVSAEVVETNDGD